MNVNYVKNGKNEFKTTSLISLAPFNPFETVLIDTPSRAAISLIVAIVFVLSYVIIKLYIYYQK